MSRRIKSALITLILAVSLTLSFGAGCTIGTSTVSSDVGGIDVVEEAWDIIFRNYIDREKLDTSTMSGGAIKGMIEVLDDPYTSYVGKEAYEMSVGRLEGKFEGIGAYVGMRDEQIIIIAPIPGSPAAEAGVMPGDVILEVDGNSTSGLNLEETVLQVRGPRGTTVTLLILHEGETQPVEIKIIRAEIKVPSVHYEMKDDIAYIRINYFTERTSTELSTVVKSLSQDEASGIILDLRRNPGGILEVVVDVVSYFLDDGVVVYAADVRGGRTPYSVKPKSVTTDLPMVVLTDNFSASGSEVLAGALQDHARAVIAGTITYGKGSINALYKLKDGSGLYITTSRWLTPNGHLIEGEGIKPDYEIELEGEDAIQWAIQYLKGMR